MQTTEKILPAPVEQTRSVSLSHQQQLMEAFRTMNIAVFEELLSEELTYNDENKWKFLAGLKSQFEEFKSAGDTELIACEGNCKGCRLEMKGFRFTGNDSGKKVEFVFEENENAVIDLFRCQFFQGDNDEPLNSDDYDYDVTPW